MASLPGQSDQRWSLAHRLLISKFLRPHRVYPASTGDLEGRWKAALGESEEEALHRLVTAGHLIQCCVAEKLVGCFSATQLKQMLRDRQQKLSGTKDQMAERLCSADPGGMEKAVTGIILLRCSETGEQLANQFLARKEDVLRNALEALRQRNLELAVSVVSSFNDELGFPIDPMFSSSRETLSEQLRRTFTTSPKILSGVDEKVLECCRIAAGMSFLGLGLVWPPCDPETKRKLEDGILDVPSMIISSVQSGMNLEDWRTSSFVKSIKIVGSSGGDSCPACKAAQKAPWPIKDVPELPIPNCTSEGGCNCSYVLHEISE